MYRSLAIAVERACIAGRIVIEAVLHVVGAAMAVSRRDEKGNGKKRVAFQAYAPHLAQFFRPLIERLRHQDVEITFVILMHPQFPLRTVAELRHYAREELDLCECNIRPHWLAVWDRYDLVVHNDVYTRFSFGSTANWLLSHGAGATRRLVKRSPLRKTVSDFDAILTAGPRDARIIKSCCGADADTPAIEPVGIPFLDRLVAMDMPRTAYLRALKLDPAKKTVLFAPHWNLGSAFHTDFVETVDRCLSLLGNANCNVIVKMHACSLIAALSGYVPWREKLEALRGVSVDWDVDDVPALAFSDVLISDASSRALNYMLIDKPVILLPQVASADPIDADRAQMMRSGSHVLDRIDELEAAIARAIRNPDDLRAERRRVAAEYFTNIGTSTDAVAKLMLDALALSAIDVNAARPDPDGPHRPAA